MMRAPISVVIPTLNAGTSLHGSLACLMEGVEAGVIREVIVSDGGSTDQTIALAKDWGAEIVSGPASRGGQLRRGCAAAQGAWLLVLHADTQLSPGWVGPVMRHMQGRKAGWFQLAFDKGGLPAKIVAGWANWRSRRGLPYGDQGLFLSRDMYAAVGGYADQPLMEDVAIARALKGQLAAIDAVATTSAQKYQSQGWMRRGGRNLLVLLRYYLGADVETLARSYRK